MKSNFSDIVEFLKDVGEKEIINFLNRAQKNTTYTSKLQLKIISATLVIILSELIDNIKLAKDFSLLVDESTNEAYRSKLLIFVCYVNPPKALPS